jgi:hypothetical protein
VGCRYEARRISCSCSTPTFAEKGHLRAGNRTFAPLCPIVLVVVLVLVLVIQLWGGIERLLLPAEHDNEHDLGERFTP